MSWPGSSPLNSTAEFNIYLAPPGSNGFAYFSVASGSAVVGQSSNFNNTEYVFASALSGLQPDNVYVAIEIPASTQTLNTTSGQAMCPAFGIDGTHFISLDLPIQKGVSTSVLNTSINFNNGSANFSRVTTPNFVTPYAFNGALPISIALGLSGTVTSFYVKQGGSWLMLGAYDMAAQGFTASTLLTYVAAMHGRYTGSNPFTTTAADQMFWGPITDLTGGTGVPSTSGLPLGVAYTSITNAGFVVGTVSSACSNTIPIGYVINTVPSGGSVIPPGSTVDIVVSNGLCSTTVFAYGKFAPAAAYPPTLLIDAKGIEPQIYAIKENVTVQT